MNIKNHPTFVSVLKALKNEEVIAYPTESVFGLGCDPDSQKAVNNLLRLKQRTQKKGLILIAASYQQLQPYINDEQVSTEQRKKIFTSWPGHFTWVFPISTIQTPTWLSGEFNSLAVRVSSHPLVRQLCYCFGKPLVSSSANITSQTPCRTSREVVLQFGHQLSVLSGNVGGHLKPSEIRDTLTDRLIRSG
ncbi:Sua5/YciO/YrdC/YwlC family protein [Candidatus Williamhamiltonella defendens]|uniref:Sua5/YciO/YrdC/YwlC family protein n=1 Tax=Candidatus Williamhamiltonella defendens TaxID=138072 RepID=UPI00130EC7EB|nr:Sua5/YciO/YrdC/YwlC family protein [Candidatus Hamiltonella defensa]